MKTANESISPMQLRRAAGLTQREVSIALDVTESTVRRWEKKVTMPHLPLDKVKLLTELYDCSLDDLVLAFSVMPTKEKELQSDTDDENLLLAS